jgi:hypothetical protein
MAKLTDCKGAAGRSIDAYGVQKGIFCSIKIKHLEQCEVNYTSATLLHLLISLTKLLSYIIVM